jgi:hypothetical protein
MTGSAGMALQNLAYLIGAVTFAALGGLVLWLRHRAPKSVDANVHSFQRGLQALAPPRPPRTASSPETTPSPETTRSPGATRTPGHSNAGRPAQHAPTAPIEVPSVVIISSRRRHPSRLEDAPRVEGEGTG